MIGLSDSKMCIAEKVIEKGIDCISHLCAYVRLCIRLDGSDEIKEQVQLWGSRSQQGHVRVGLFWRRC